MQRVLTAQLVILDSATPILDALKTLAQYHILAAPVRDVTKPDTADWAQKYLGFLDMVCALYAPTSSPVYIFIPPSFPAYQHPLPCSKALTPQSSIVTFMLERLEPLGKAPEDFETEAATIEEFKTTTVGDALSKCS